jgi:GGDEF domain-containing protein
MAIQRASLLAAGNGAHGSRAPYADLSVVRPDAGSLDRASLPPVMNDRSTFLRRLRDDLAEATRSSRGLTLFVCDVLDDEADMTEIARLVRPMMRWRDHMTVLSGRRLALVLASCSPEQILPAKKRLRKLLAENGRRIRIAAARAPDRAQDAFDFLRLTERSVTALAFERVSG